MPVKKFGKRWEEYPFPRYIPFETCIRTIIKSKKKESNKGSIKESKKGQKLMKTAECTKSELKRSENKIRSDSEITCMEVVRVETANNSIDNTKNDKGVTIEDAENVKEVKHVTEDVTGNVKSVTIDVTVKDDVKSVIKEVMEAGDVKNDDTVNFKDSEFFRCGNATSNNNCVARSSSESDKGRGITKVGNRIDVKVKKEVKKKKKGKGKTDKSPWSSCDEKCCGKNKKDEKSKDRDNKCPAKQPECSRSHSHESKSDSKLLKKVKCKTKKNPSVQDVIQSVESNGRRCCDLIELYLRETCRFYNGYYFDEGAEQSHFQETVRELGRTLACMCKNCFQYMRNFWKQIFF